MSDPQETATPDVGHNVAEEAKDPIVRIVSRRQAGIYVQNLLREVLLNHIEQWRAMRKDAAADGRHEDRVELDTVLAEAEGAAKALRMTVEALEQAEMRVVVANRMPGVVGGKG